MVVEAEAEHRQPSALMEMKEAVNGTEGEEELEGDLRLTEEEVKRAVVGGQDVELAVAGEQQVEKVEVWRA